MKRFGPFIVRDDVIASIHATQRDYVQITLTQPISAHGQSQRTITLMNDDARDVYDAYFDETTAETETTNTTYLRHQAR